MALLQVDENEFVILVIRPVGREIDNLLVPKVSLNGKEFYDIPYELQDIEKHQIIKDTSGYRVFSKYLKERIEKGLDKLWTRNLKFNIQDDKGELTKIAKLYLIKEGNEIKIGSFQQNELQPEKQSRDFDILNLDFSIEELSQVSALYLLLFDEGNY